ncbi:MULTISPECIES: hypothetical protein [unclassified Sphingomonas]|uniref:hypothetical protein n=1 Tax=unclassified Sphingomonas TaxID=196159 RepID=UPI000A7D2088|nr:MULTISPECIES: hypothetical protein [unclassified Sphingomonas]
MTFTILAFAAAAFFAICCALEDVSLINSTNRAERDCFLANFWLLSRAFGNSAMSGVLG